MRMHLLLSGLISLSVTACDFGSSSSTPTEPPITTVSARATAEQAPVVDSGTPAALAPTTTATPGAVVPGAAKTPTTVKPDGGVAPVATLPPFAIPSGLPTAITIPTTLTVPSNIPRTIAIPSQLPPLPTAPAK